MQAQQLLLNTLDSVIQTFESIDGDIEEIKKLFEHGIAGFKRRASWVAHQRWEQDLELILLIVLLFIQFGSILDEDRACGRNYSKVETILSDF